MNVAFAASLPIVVSLGSHAGAGRDQRVPTQGRFVGLGNRQAQRLGSEIDCDQGRDVGRAEPLTRDESHLG